MKEVLELVIKVSENIVEVGGKIQTQLKEVEKAAQSAASKVEEISNRFSFLGKVALGVGGALLGAYTAIAVAGSRLSDTINKQSKQLGVSADKWLAYKYALEDAEVNSDALMLAITRLTFNITQQAKKEEEARNKLLEKWAKQQNSIKKTYSAIVSLNAATTQGVGINNAYVATFGALQRQIVATNEAQQRFISTAATIGKTFASEVADPITSALSQLGINASKFKDPMDLFIATVSRLREIRDPILQSSLAFQLFGRQATEILALVRGNFDEFLASVELYKKVTAGFGEEEIRKIDDLSDRLSTLKVGLQTTAAIIHASTAPALSALTEKVTEMVASLNNFLKQHPKIAAAAGSFMLVGGTIASLLGGLLQLGAHLALVVVHWGALTKVLGWVGRVFGWLGGVLTAIKVVAEVVAGAVAGLAAALGLPVWAVVALIAAIAAAIAAVVAFRKEIWNFIKNAAKWLWDGLKFVAKSIWEFLKEIWEAMKRLPATMWEGLKGALRAAHEWGRNLVLSLWEGIKSLAMKPVEAFHEILKKIRNMLPFSPPKEGALKDLPIAAQNIGRLIAENINIPTSRIIAQLANIKSAVADFSIPTPTLATAAPTFAAVGGRYTYTINITSDKEINDNLRKAIAQFIESEFIPFLRRVM